MYDQLLSTVLRPYVPDCRYLKSVTFEPPRAPNALPTATGQFSIPKAFYIEDTGHFNAVEFILCFNQLGYMLTAHCALTGAFPGMQPWSMEQFQQNQLPNVLIVDVQAAFPKAIDGKAFSASLSISWMEARSRHLFYDMLIEFTDPSGGRAAGKIRVCLRHCYDARTLTEWPRTDKGAASWNAGFSQSA